MMPDMWKEEQPENNRPFAWCGWAFLLLPILLMGYVLWIGQGLAWNNEFGRYWFYFAPWWTNTSVKYVALSGILSAFCFWGGERVGRWASWGLGLLLIASQWGFALSAWGALRGAVPWGFDHPSFMFRLKEFGDLFPFALGGYNPWWNAGTEHFVGVTSGAHGFGMLILPLLKIWEPHVFYGAAILFWFVFVFPWMGVASVRAAGVGMSGSLFAGLLMCGASRGIFIWMWHFGTMGAMTSAMMALPVVALGYRLAVLRRGSWGTALLLALAAWLMCLWTPGVFIGAGVALGWLWSFREWSWRSNRWLFAAGALALILLSPWIWHTLFPCHNVVEYVGTVLERPGLGTMAWNGMKRLVCTMEEMHPLLLFLGVLGTFLFVPREMRRWMAPLILVLVVITGWSREWKPLSQLDRMAIPLAVVSVFPASVLCGRIFRSTAEQQAHDRRRRWLWAVAQGIVLATLLMGFRVTKMHFSNQGQAPMRMLSPEMKEFVAWIRDEVPQEGRLGFAGKAVHFYGGGNIAYLPVLTGREMMADDYYGFPRGTIEYNFPPSTYRKELDSYLFFTRAYGITHWVATMPDALEFLSAHPDQFERVKTMTVLERTIEVYRVKEPGTVSRFWEGTGRVQAKENSLDVFPEDPSGARVVIRYNWREGLVCRTPGASIEPFPVDSNLRFIAIHPGGNEHVRIGYRPHAAPVKPNFDGHFHH